MKKPAKLHTYPENRRANDEDAANIDLTNERDPISKANVLRIYSACVFGKNALTAARLSAKGLSIPRLVHLAVTSLRGLPGTREESLEVRM